MNRHSGRFAFWRALTLGIVIVSAATGAIAQVPSVGGKVIRILVGFPPGQATDLVARVVAERLAPALGQAVIVDNKPGQGGSIALAAIAKSAPDGTVLSLSALAAYVVNPYLYKNAGYETLRDFEPVGMVADLPLVLAVHPEVPAATLGELVAYAKSRPDKLAHSSSGNGTLSHLLMEDFKQRAGVRILHVPYTGSARAMTDLVGGNVQVGLDTAAVVHPQANAGKLRVLAVGTLARLPAFPDVPAFAELGYPGFEAIAWIALSAPAGTPRAVRERIGAEVQKIVRSPDFAHKLAAMGSVPHPGDIDEMAAFVRKEDARWKSIVAQTGVKVD